MRKTFRYIIIAAILIYILAGLLFYLFQDKLFFHPVKLNSDHQFVFDQPFEEVNIPLNDNNLNFIKIKPVSTRRGIVLFFHGNMENVEYYKKYPSLFTRNGYEIWMIDYPGFGKTTGKRNEKIMYEQSALLYQLALKEISADSLVIYGKSIGTGVASWLASGKKSGQLIMETPYYSIEQLVRDYVRIYPVSVLLKYKFPVNEHLRKSKSPVVIFHGREDEIIPYSHSEKLLKENPKIELISITEGKHNDLFSFQVYQDKMDSLLRD